ncbi:MAG: hypothetical protein IJS90_01080 [Clostridia bacterium]|nr:hypothetical protein [Clostridia bacterium]
MKLMKIKRILCLLLVICLLLPACGKKDKSTDSEPQGEQTSSDAVEIKSDLSTYQQAFMPDIVRPVSASDVVRNKEYVVDDEKIESLISLLDYAINSPEIADMLGLDIAGLIQTVVGGLYNDGLINTIIQYLYPLVEKEFAKVWADIPEELEIKDVETGVKLVPKANVIATLDIDPIETSLTQIDFYLFPTTLADILPEKYSDVKSKLKLAQTPSKYDKSTDTLTTPWEDPVLLDENGNLDLRWGVTDRDSFIEAASAALQGVEPLLLALLCNQACDNRGNIGRGVGKAKVLNNILKLNMDISAIELVLTASANEGYNNTVAPILEVFGLTAPDGNSFTCTRDVIEKGIIEPVAKLLDSALKAPVSFILSALPNLAYALEAGLVVPLLSMLKTDIYYTSNADYTVQIAGDGRMNDAYKADEPIKINVGEMIDLGEMGVDVSSLNGLLSSLSDMIGFTLPEIDGAKLATLGTLTWHDTVRSDWTYTGVQNGQAARIEANKADVLQFLLDYVFKALSDKELLDGILGMVSSGGQLPELVNTIIDKVVASPDMAVAALTELLIPQSYPEPAGITWKNISLPSNAAAPLYTSYWTAEKADYMWQNLPTLVDNILGLADMEIMGIKAKSLSDLFDGIIGMICKPDLLNDLAKKISGAISGLSLPSMVTDLLKNKLGIDLSYWSYYKASFAVGDKEGFKKAVSSLVSPIQSLIDFLLLDKDITVSIAGAEGDSRELIRLQGANAYATAVIPLLEAFGVTGIPSPSDMKANSSKLLPYIIDAVFGVVDQLKADPYNKLTGMIPNLLYFIQSGCLTSAVNNLLHSVDLLLDIIRPIYDVNISSLIGFDIRFQKTDVMALLSGLISDLIKEELGVDVSLGLTTQKMYNDLVSGQVESFTSVNGAASKRINEKTVNRRDMLTVIYDFLLKELLFSDNTPKYLAFAKEKLGLNDTVFGYLEKIVPAVKEADASYPGSGKALIFWVFFAADSITGAMSSGNTSLLGIMGALMGSGNAEKRAFASSELPKDMRNEGFSNIFLGILKPLFS